MPERPGSPLLVAILLLFPGAFACAAADPGPRWDHRRGWYFAPFQLELTPPSAGVTLRFTTDGSEPTATRGSAWQRPLFLTNTTVVRAVAIAAGRVPSTVETRSFIFPGEVYRQTGAGLPGAWGVHEGKPVPASYSPNPGWAGDPNRQAALLDALRALPTISLVIPPEDLFEPERGLYSHPQDTGETWERTASLEFLPVDGAKGFQLGCGIRIQGGWSRRPQESPKHSFRLIFRKRHGAAHLDYPLFGPGTTRFETLILRAGNNNTWLHPSSEERRRADYLRDSWMRATSAAMDRPAARDRFVHVFLNGLYWGIYDLCERPDANFAASRFGGEAADYDSRNGDKVLGGDDVAWRRLFRLANAGVAGVREWEEICGLLDGPAFADYMILNLYGANGDWDRASNWYAVRRRQPAGRWMFLVWDGERTLEQAGDNRLADDDDQSPMRLFQKLRENSGFRRVLADRARKHLAEGGALGPVVAADRYRQLADGLDRAITAEAARWGHYRRAVHPFKLGPFEDYSREEHWRPEVKRLIGEYFPRRTGVFRSQLIEAGLLAP